MRILVLGADGYIGKPLSMHLEGLGHHVLKVDNFSRQVRAGWDLTHDVYTSDPTVKVLDVSQLKLADYKSVEAIYHLAEMPSAPWSMRSANFAHKTQQENVLGTLHLLWEIKDHCPDAHLIKIGSMGEYGYNHSVRIPEGFIEDGPLKGMPFPRSGGSFYHLSKSFDSMNIEKCCEWWGLRSTDIMQGIVFGLNYWDEDLTRFDYDEYFGTVINRFVVQALAGHPLTVYGKGGQTRGFLPLRDSIDCLTLALDNPPEAGEYRVFNQFAESYSVLDLAKTVKMVGAYLGYDVKIDSIPNPRKELEEHDYSAATDNLRNLGYNPQWMMRHEILKLMEALKPYRDRINKSVIMPVTKWER